jgi:ABC-type transporter Mla maintaining outer membrane lipid asymmetry ATPase subunit MlaF
MSEGPPLLELTGVVKEYQALRPLRLQSLRVSAGSIVSVSGIDAAGAEVLVNLVTAATRPDAGAVRLFGAATDAIEDYEGWLKMLDGLGLLTERAVLLRQCSVAQNVALPLTLEIDPIRAEVLPMVQALATEAGIAPSSLDTLVGEAPPAVVQRVRLARALALGPRLLIAEHPSAPLPREAVVPLARDLAAISASRGLGLLAVSADREFVRALGGTALTLNPATGALTRSGLLARFGLGR